MKSVGIELEPWVKQGLLFQESWRPTQFGLEMHLLRIHKLIEQIEPRVVIIDPITNLVTGTGETEVQSMLMRLMDFLKAQLITSIFVSLTEGGDSQEKTNVGISSLTDTWIMLRDTELNGERNRCLYVLKSRGMEHSNQIREFVLTNDGLRLLDVYLGPEGVLTGSARVSQEGREKAEGTSRRQQLEGRGRELERKRQIFEARMTMLRAEFEVEEEVIQQSISESKLLDHELLQDRGQMVRSREADASAYKTNGNAAIARPR